MASVFSPKFPLLKSNSSSFEFIPPQEMENGAESKWGFQVKQELKPAPAVTVRTSLASIIGSVNTNDPRPVISLGPGDPTTFPCFRTATEAEDAIVDAVRSANFNFLQLEGKSINYHKSSQFCIMIHVYLKQFCLITGPLQIILIVAFRTSYHRMMFILH